MARFVLALIVGLGLLTWAASGFVEATARKWFERDVNLRSQTTLVAARQSLTSSWYDPQNLRRQLQDLARDERVMGVAVCNADLTPRSRTQGFPEEFRCSIVGSRARVTIDGVDRFQSWNTVATLPSGRVYVSVMPLESEGQQLGFVTLLHDLSFIGKREAKTRNFLLGVFGILAILAYGVPLLAAKRARYDWIRDLHNSLRGVKENGKPKREFQPILGDVLELAAQIANDREGDPGQWTAERLKQTLNRHLHGEKIIIVANREPYVHQYTGEGGIEVRHPASGLVTALEPVMRACSGVWIAHGSGTADRETVDRRDHVRVPPEEKSYEIRRIWLTEAEEQGYYYGFSNEGLWPLCHVAHARPAFRAEDWRHYQIVNQKFADAVCEEADTSDPIVLVQDYHFALVPAMIRRRLPAATVIMFWHIPWPNGERMGICPWRDEILTGLLGSSILGFHTQLHCNNFLDSVDRYLETRIDREHNAVVMRSHRTLIRPYPIAVEWPVRWAEDAPDPEECRAQVWRDLGLKPNALLGVGVDRLDYTKGIEERLMTVETLLERYPEFRGRFTFAQVAAPSRTRIERYQQLSDAVEELADRINRRFGRAGYQPVILLRSHHEPPAVFRFYRAAHLCYVSSLHDGMNLVAKEFVAARSDLKGVLLLSEFTGAARELTEALIVNPYDLEGSARAMAVGLTMPVREQQDRMRSMRSVVGQFNVYRWAGKMLVDAARRRSQERVAGRIAENSSIGAAV